MAVGPGVDVAFSSPTPIGHMDRVWWAGVAYSPKAPEWLVGVWTPCTDYGHTVALGKDRPRIELSNDGGTVNLDRTNRLWTFSPSAAVAQ